MTGSPFQIVTKWFRDWSSGVQTQVRYNTEKEKFGDVPGDWWVVTSLRVKCKIIEIG